MRPFLFAVLCLWAPTLQAQTYDLSVAGGVIGTLTHTPGRIESRVTSSPLGVGNGQFLASSQLVQMADGRQVTQYLSDSPNKGRQISVLHAQGQVIEVAVSPAGDATDMSNADAVPRGVGDPVAAVRHLLADRGTCPQGISFFEGRRVITISPAGSTATGDTLRCDLTYRVTAGPGHFSPLYIKRAAMEISYQNGQLQEIAISAALFTLRITPR